MVSLPAEIDFELPAGYRPKPGSGVALTDGDDVLLISSGPTMLAQAVADSAQPLPPRESALSVVNLPWLNRVDPAWLDSAIGSRRLLVTLDDHYVEGGQGEKVMSALASTGRAVKTLKLGLTSVPPSGQPGEVLGAIGLDAAGISRSIRNALYSR